MMTYPAYLQLYKSGELFTRIEKGKALLQGCRICPRRCKVNRLKDKHGVCKVGRHIKVSSYAPHFGEESPLVGMHGSGTIFITSCIAVKGLIVRHLVMPNGLAGTRKVMQFLSREISPGTYVNIMDQYRPCGLAGKHPEINRRIRIEEFENAIEMAHEEGLHWLDSE